MTAQTVVRVAKAVFVHGLTQAVGSAFTPLLTKLAAIPPSQRDEYASGDAVSALIEKRAAMLSDAISQYAGGPELKPADLAQPKPANADTARMLAGPWEAAAKGIAGQEFQSIAGPLHTFATAAAQRAALSGLPPRDMAMLNNVLLLLALGAVSYWASGQATTADPKAWASEAVERSGLADIFTGGDHIVIDAPTLRGLRGDGSAMDKGAAGRVSQLLLMHNLHYVRQLFDAAAQGAKTAFGIPLNG